MPELPEEEGTTRLGFSVTVVEKRNFGAEELKEGSQWESEDSRAFYEDLKDLRSSFPASHFDEKKGKGKDTKEEATAVDDKPKSDADMEALEKEMEANDEKTSKLDEEYALASPKLFPCQFS